MLNNIIDFEGVTFYYNRESGRASLKNINLHIKEGETVVLCGTSGCGKSTIIRMINGLIPFYYSGEIEGNVKVYGKKTDNGNIYDLGSKVSTVFQNPKSQFFCVDVKSELAFGAENMNFKKEEILKRIEKVGEELDINHLLGRTMFQLSGGEKQKIACACASVMDNKIIVLDEPSSNLDMRAIEELKKMIEYWKKEGKTIVIAEHRLQYLKEIGDRFIYLNKGKIEKEFNREEFKNLKREELNNMGLRNTSYNNLEIRNKREADKSIKIKDFKFRYKGSKDLNLDIKELDIPKGAVVAVIGKNGAGKSTFLRNLCGLEKKGEGVLFDGNSKYKTRKRLNKAFFVMQDVNHQLFTEDVEEEILLSMKSRDDELLNSLIKEFDLSDYRKNHPMSLSGGQKQRVAIASAIASQREYISFDEPTSGLDYLHMKQVAECVKKLQEKGNTVFIITHDIELIYSCCNVVLHISNGRLREKYILNEENEYKLKEFFGI